MGGRAVTPWVSRSWTFEVILNLTSEAGPNMDSKFPSIWLIDSFKELTPSIPAEARGFIIDRLSRDGFTSCTVRADSAPPCGMQACSSRRGFII
jgi:hypothetical protein